MTTAAILFILTFGGGTVKVTHVEFDNMPACLFAMERLSTMSKKARVPLELECVSKAAE